MKRNIIVRIFRKIQKMYYTFNGLHIGRNSIVREFVYIDHPKNVYIGNKSSINPFSTLQIGASDTAKIIIGNNVGIAAHCKISCITHEIGTSERRFGKHLYKDVTIKDGCWIGLNVTIISGVTINEGCIIAAGAVVVKDTEPNCLYGGVPAKKIREL